MTPFLMRPGPLVKTPWAKVTSLMSANFSGDISWSPKRSMEPERGFTSRPLRDGYTLTQSTVMGFLSRLESRNNGVLINLKHGQEAEIGQELEPAFSGLSYHAFVNPHNNMMRSIAEACRYLGLMWVYDLSERGDIYFSSSEIQWMRDFHEKMEKSPREELVKMIQLTSDHQASSRSIQGLLYNRMYRALEKRSETLEFNFNNVRLPEKADWSFLLLKRSRFSKQSIYGHDFHGADLTSSIFFECGLHDVDMTGAHLTDASFNLTALSKVKLRDTDLFHSRFQGALFEDVDMTWHMTSRRKNKQQYICLSGARLKNVKFGSRSIERIELYHLDCQEHTLPERQGFFGVMPRETRRTQWLDCQLFKMFVFESNLQGNVFHGTTFEDLYVKRSSFIASEWDQCGLEDVTFDECRFWGAAMNRMELGKNVVFKNCTMNSELREKLKKMGARFIETHPANGQLVS